MAGHCLDGWGLILQLASGASAACSAEEPFNRCAGTICGWAGRAAWAGERNETFQSACHCKQRCFLRKGLAAEIVPPSILHESP